MGQASNAYAKIDDPALRRLAETDSDESASVFIALDIPAPAVEFSRARGGAGRAYAPRRVAPPSPSGAADEARAAAEVRALLRDVLGAEPRWLRAARAFVATASGRQLGAIVGSPLVRAVSRNRAPR